MRRPLIIYGAGGLGREVKSMLQHTEQPFELIGFLDDGVTPGTMVDSIPVLGGVNWLEVNTNKIDVIVAIGNPKIKSKIVRSIHPMDYVNFPRLIHKLGHTQDMERVTIGAGSVIGAGVVLTTNITIGEHVLLNLNVTVGHDTVIGDFTSVMPGVNIAGNVRLGSEVMIGSGANIINNIKVGNFATIGAGSVVNHDIPAASTAAGVPARVIK